MEHLNIDRWFEGDNCPHCLAEEEVEFYDNTEGGINDDFVRHNYVCSECGGKWYNETEFQTWVVK
tara:strand:- start:70 stop:264 length:195 start_codon:yes stop_codon:yes gene_type:complete